ncbi:MAG: hypothetical protein KatS3mg032_0021 [Cyclobacteriaceae bacterium]|nr:MAG: hypothetical protein KatS3mg032_0021 [Cyclobacteriaceae bacterium]
MLNRLAKLFLLQSKLYLGPVMWFCLVHPLIAQVASVQSGDWNDTNTWDCGCVPDFSSGQITISPFTTVTIPNGFTADADEILVDSDGTLTILNGGKLIVRDGTGDDLTVTIGDGFFTFDGFLNVNAGGTLENRGQIVCNLANTTISGTFLHNQNGGTIPEATWSSGSTLEVSGVTNAAPSGFNQIFYNLIWNSNGQTASVSLAGSLLQVDNDFIVNNTGTNRALILQTSGSGSLTVGRDLIIQNAASLGITQSGSFTLTINRNLVVNSTATNSLLFVSSGNVTVNVLGNVTKSNTGNIVFCSGSSLATGTLNVAGNFTFSGGGITESNSNAASNGNINFNGSALQTFTGGGSFSNTINFTIAPSATVDLGTYSLAGTGTFVLNGTLRVGSTDVGGAIQSGTTNGNIRVSGTRTYTSGSTIVYNGTGAQFIGNGHPATAGVNCTINNANGVTLAVNATIGGNLTLTNGNLSVGNNVLTLGGNVSAGSNNIIVSSGSGLVINGSGALGTFPFPAGAQTFATLTLNRTSGSVTFANPVTITGAVTLNAGNLVFNNQTLELSGTLNSTGGALSGNASSTLLITGSGDFGSLPFSSGGNTINTLTLNRSSGTVTLNNTLTITNALNLVQGTLDNVNGLQLSNGATITRNPGGALTGDAVVQPSGDRYNVVYEGSGAMNTGVELPTVSDDHLGNLTINGGPVTLTQNIRVNGDVNLLNTTLNAGSFNIEMAGSPGIWNRQSGSFNPGTGTVTISGSISVQSPSGTPQFGNLTVNSGATFTALSGIMNILGNLQLDAGSTFNHNNGTLSFNGSSTQVLAGAGKVFNNINVNKSGGNLQLASTTNVRGALTVVSSTTIESDGNLVLQSSSDGTSGNARVGTLPAGASVTGNVTVQRFMTDEGRIYRYLTAPVSGFSVASLQSFVPVTGSFSGSSTCSGCTSNPSMYRYNETVSGAESQGWVPFPSSSNTEQLQTGVGYAVFVRDNIIPGNVRIDWSGPMHQGSISLPVTYTNTGNPSADGWNLVGNPYPSSIDWDFASGWTKTNISGTIAVRDNGSGGIFRYWDGTTGSFANGEIATAQAFWVRTIASSPALTVNENAKTTATATFYRKQEDLPADVLEVVLNSGTLADFAYVRLREEALNELDEYDGPKLDNDIFDLFTYSSDSLAMAINALQELDCSQPLVLGTKDLIAGSYSLSLHTSGIFEQYRITLYDNFTGRTEELAFGEEYLFDVTSDPKSKDVKRFYLTLAPLTEVHFSESEGVLTSSYATGNQWFKDGLPIEGATGQSFEPTESGTYTLTVQIGTCAFQAPESFTHIVTGINPEQKGLMIYPNPAYRELVVLIPTGDEAVINLTSMSGNSVKSGTVSGNLGAVNLDISDLKEGLYLVTVTSKGKVFRSKFLKLAR